MLIPQVVMSRKKKQTWYSGLTDEKREEYLEKQRVARQQKKAAVISVDSQQVSQTNSSSLPSVLRTPLSTVTSTPINGIILTFVTYHIDGPYIPDLC